MSDLISRDELLRYVNERIDKIKEIRDSAKRNGEEDVFSHCNGEITEARGMKLHLNMFAPPVDAVPVVHARWDEPQGFQDGFWVCSACNFCTEAIAAPQLYNYCPNCGSQMDSEGDD